MSYTYEKVSSNKAKLSFTIPAEEFDAAVETAYKKNRNKINIPGFRKGKAPRKMIETMYGESVFFEDAIDEIFGKVYGDAVEAEKLEVVDRPDVNVEEVGHGKELKFTCEVFVRPDVELGDYKHLEVAVAKDQVTDEAIDARINQDREKASRTVEVDDRAVENGDNVNLDYAGTVDGVAFEGGTAQNQQLTIGSNRFIPGFEEQMIGMAIGEEKDMQVKFPENYHAKDLAGKDAVFHVKVNRISKTEMPELDDDFAADVSEFDTFSEYRDSIVKELSDRAEKNYEIEVENALIEKAVEGAKMDVPSAMIDTEVDYLMREMQMQMAYQGIRLDDYLKYTNQKVEDVRAMHRTDAEHRVKIQLVIEAIRKAEGIEASEEDIEKEIANQAERMGKTADELRKTLTEEQKGYINDSAAAQKVVDLLREGATVTEPKAEEATEKAAE